MGADHDPSTEARRLRRDAQRNRERILAAAGEVFAERGVDATLDEVAARAGVGVGTVYRRYPNKAALLDELFEQRIAELASIADEAAAEADAWRALTRFLERLEELLAADRALEHLVVGAGPGQERVARARERLRAPVAALVERAKAAGRLRADVEAADISILHTMLAAVVARTRDSAPDLWRRYLALLVDGLASRRSAPSPLPAAPPAAEVSGEGRT